MIFCQNDNAMRSQQNKRHDSNSIPANCQNGKIIYLTAKMAKWNIFLIKLINYTRLFKIIL
jgi:hypothetical protein